MVNRPIKVLYINGNIMKRGGIEAFMMNYFRHIDRNKVHIDFVVHGYDKGVYDDEILAVGSKIYHVPTKSKHPIAYQKKLREIFSSGEYQIVHSHCDAMSGWILKIAKECGVPIRIAHSHNTNHLTQNRIKIFVNEISRKQITKYATHCFACGEQAGKWLFGDHPFEVINNAIELQQFRYSDTARAQVRKEFGFKEDEFVFGHVGRFDTQKNHAFLVDTFQKVAQKNEKVRLLLVGEGWLMDKIKNQVAEEKLLDRVIFAGSRANVCSLYSGMDCFLLPSLFEGLGIVAVEAQANGLPCLLADTVPNQVQLTSLVHFLPLDNNVWSEAMEKVVMSSQRLQDVNLSQSGYDIRREARILQDKYLEMSRKINK